jgi:hypothetical protein
VTERESASGERERRISLNESMFRQVNERIDEIAGKFDLAPLDIVCECGDPACSERVTITRPEYASLRSDPELFAIVSGHEKPDVERVVERRKGYDIVRKDEGVSAEVARELDPRS